MTAHDLPFGYYPYALDIQSGAITVSTLPDLEATVAAINSSEGIEKNWIYPPAQEAHWMGADVRISPYPSRVFSLPKTHKLHHANPDSEDHLNFHLWGLSLFTGMRLTSTEAGFLDATPLKRGTLVDFVTGVGELTKILTAAEAFWIRNRSDPRSAQRFAAAIHALFIAQNPRMLQFEEFIYLYTAFDACFALAKSLNPPNTRISHAGRIEWMRSQFNMQIPTWAQAAQPAGSEVSIIRNDTLHEALFMGQPLGFAIHSTPNNQNITLEMRALVCRFLVALLNTGETSYVKSRVDSRQMHGLKLP